jgi:hypothetical protein
VLLVELVVEVATNSFLVLGSMPSGFLPAFISGRELGELRVEVAACSGAPEMISGVRASSMRMLSDLVDDRVVVHADRPCRPRRRAAVLDLLLQRGRHVVAQVVEAELRVGAVGDVAA